MPRFVSIWTGSNSLKKDFGNQGLGFLRNEGLDHTTRLATKVWLRVRESQDEW
jgi:hypothetical protein